MTTENRFDQIIITQAADLAKEITKHKEVRSVAVIVDWDMPSQEGLPSGLWYHSPDRDPLMCSLSMSAQLGRSVANQARASLNIIGQAVAGAKDQKGKEDVAK